MHPKVIAEHFSLIDEKTPIKQPDLALLSSKLSMSKDVISEHLSLIDDKTPIIQ